MTIEVRIKGTQQILLHKYVTSTVTEEKLRSSIKDSSNYAEEWKTHTYLDDEGQVIIPWANVIASLFDGAKGTKIGKSAVTRLLHTSIFVSSPDNLVYVDGKPVTIERIKSKNWLHINGAVVSGRRIDRIRTCLPIGWECSFTLQTRPLNKLSEKDIRGIVDSAGSNAGFGDWRPSAPKKPGPYGTFEVVGWEVNN